MKLNLLLTSDVHGYLVPTNYVNSQMNAPFSLERAATCLKKLQNKHKYTLTFDDGDYLEGSPLSFYLAKIKKESAPHELDAAFNQMHYDFGIVGNHEFNYGQTYLKNSIQESHRQFLCANVVDSKGHHPFGQPYTVKQVGPLKVAVMGLTTQGTTKWEKSKNLRGLKFISAVTTAKKYVPIMRKQADVVIVAYHGGFERNKQGVPTEILKGENESYQMLKEVKGIDALLTGHQHRIIADHLFGVPTIQVGHRGELVGVITLNLNHNHQVTDSHVKLIPTKSFAPDPKVTKIIQPTEEAVDHWLNRPLAKINGSLSFKSAPQARIHKCNFIEFIQRVQMATMGADISAASLFTNEAHGFENPITLRNIMTNYVYPNTLSLSVITGKILKEAMEQSAKYFTYRNGKITVSRPFVYPKPLNYCYDMYEGVNYVMNVAKPIGHRITKLTYHGKPVQPNQKLRIVLNTYRAVGGGHYSMFNKNQIIKTNRTVMDQVIANYLKKHPVINATNNHNFKVIYQK
ncbi:MAG: bifunctional metallophosphatase/5-nucleotidase [Acetilactobacillus jinshanensis]